MTPPTHILIWNSISKTMGESFKWHAQALIGYVDEINMPEVHNMPQMPEQNLVGMEATY